MNKYILIAVILAIIALTLNKKRVMQQLENISLGPNFKLSEFVKTQSGIENIPDENVIQNLQRLVTKILQPLRDSFTKKYPGKKIALIINSGYRSPLVNKAIGGAANSQHVTGQAADFYVTVDGKKITNAEIIAVANSLPVPYDQIIDENLKGKTWVHVSYKTPPRFHWLTATDGPNGEVIYNTVNKS